MHRLVHRAVNLARAQAARLAGRRVTSEYVKAAPSPQHALDLFAGEWSSYLPGEFGHFRAGPLPLFHDDRLTWAIERLGGVERLSVLELGPLEGAHTWMLEQRGVGSVLAIEANRHAYLRCLVLKEMLGDFVEYLREHEDRRFDFAVASGVLYHLPDPVDLLARLARAAPRLYLWTHYYDEEFLQRRPRVHARFRGSLSHTVAGFTHTLYPFRYEASRFSASFCGSGEASPRWMDREGLLGALASFGYDRIEVAFEEPSHIHGPSLALVAVRTSVPV
jgi:hypothetical protein